jgi:hypothetical protein
MLHVFDLRDALESERFLQAHFDPVEPAMNSTVSVAETNSAVSPQGNDLKVFGICCTLITLLDRRNDGDHSSSDLVSNHVGGVRGS